MARNLSSADGLAIPIAVTVVAVVPAVVIVAITVVSAVIVSVPPTPRLGFGRDEYAPEQERYERGDDDPRGNPDSRDSKLTQSTVA